MGVLWIAAIALATRWRRLDPRERLVIVWLVVAMAGSVVAGHLSWRHFIHALGPRALAAAVFFARASFNSPSARPAVRRPRPADGVAATAASSRGRRRAR